MQKKETGRTIEVQVNGAPLALLNTETAVAADYLLFLEGVIKALLGDRRASNEKQIKVAALSMGTGLVLSAQWISHKSRMNKSTLICEARPTVLIICFPVSSLISISHFEYFSLGYVSAKTSLMRSLMSSSVRLQPEFSKQRNMTSDLVM